MELESLKELGTVGGLTGATILVTSLLRWAIPIKSFQSPETGKKSTFRGWGTICVVSIVAFGLSLLAARNFGWPVEKAILNAILAIPFAIGSHKIGETGIQRFFETMR